MSCFFFVCFEITVTAHEERYMAWSLVGQCKSWWMHTINAVYLLKILHCSFIYHRVVDSDTCHLHMVCDVMCVMICDECGGWCSM